MTTTNPHKTAAADQIHRITGPAFATAAARITAGATLDSTNIDKAFFETSTGTYWIFLGAGLWQLLGSKRPIYTDSTTARTFGMSDAEAYFRFTNGASITGTIPPNSSAAFPIGTVLECCQAGAGQFTFAAGGGVTLGPGTAFATAGVGKVIRARKVATDTWDVTGDTAAAPSGPLVIMAGHIVAGYIPETGLTSTSWADQGPNGYHLAGTCTVQTNQINGYSCAKGNGTSDILARAQALAAPGTTPLWVMAVVRIDTFTNNRTICALGASNELAVLMHTATDQVSQFSAAAFGNSNAAGCTPGSFKLIVAKYSNSTADSIKAGGGTLVTGTNTGNTTPTGINLLSSNGGPGAVSIAEYWLLNQDPATSCNAYFDGKFPGCRT